MSGPIEFVPVTTPQQLDVIAGLAREIWYEYYVPLIGRAQVDYMVSRFQSSEAMAQQMRDGYEYFMTERDGRSIGYCAVQAQAAERSLHLSKLYLLRDARGAGTGERATAAALVAVRGADSCRDGAAATIGAAGTAGEAVTGGGGAGAAGGGARGTAACSCITVAAGVTIGVAGSATGGGTDAAGTTLSGMLLTAAAGGFCCAVTAASAAGCASVSWKWCSDSGSSPARW